METLKFTQELKDNWLKSLKSGKYIQGFMNLITDQKDENTPTKHCCIGVLGEIHPNLNNSDEDTATSKCPYEFLNNTIGKDATKKLYSINDKDINNKSYKPDYSNVIPFIEELPVQS